MAHVILNPQKQVVQILNKPSYQSVWIDDNDPKIHLFIQQYLTGYQTPEKKMIVEIVNLLLDKRLCIITDFTKNTLDSVYQNIDYEHSNTSLYQGVDIQEDMPILQCHTNENSFLPHKQHQNRDL